MPTIDDPRLFTPQCEKLTPVETVHKNEWFSVRNRGGYFTIEYNQYQVIVLPVVEENSIVMVRVKRSIINDSPLELPAGGAEVNESPIQAAHRELFEETGIMIENPKRFKLLPPMANSPNRNPLLMYIFMVNITRPEYDNRQHHDNEISAVECFSLDAVKRMMVNNEIYVSVPIAIIGRYIMGKDKITKNNGRI